MTRDKRRPRRGMTAPIVGAVAVLSVVAASAWYMTQGGKDVAATGQQNPLTVVTDAGSTPADDASASVTTPSAAPSATPAPPKIPSATPTPTRSTTAPSRRAKRTPTPAGKPTPKPSHTSTPSAPTKPKPPVPNGSKEAQVLQLTNRERAKAGCGPLRTNSALTRAADAHATDMVVHHYFDHTSQDGRSPFDRMKSAGFTGGSMAENIAVGYSSAAAIVEGWMNSEGHRRNILNCGYTMIGIGYDSGQVKPSWGSGSWVQDFGG
jgi:uncharacterized protein YkwD